MMQFDSSAFDERTRAQLKQIVARNVDCFGEPIFDEAPLSHDPVLRCLAQQPMRVRQIAVRLQANREKVATACEELMRRHKIDCDAEAFFFLREPTKH